MRTGTKTFMQDAAVSAPPMARSPKRINSVLLARVERRISLLAEFAQNNPHQITDEVIDVSFFKKPVP